jgi:hypothetical protein
VLVFETVTGAFSWFSGMFVGEGWVAAVRVGGGGWGYLFGLWWEGCITCRMVPKILLG